VKLSEKTIKVLRNFSNVNQGILFNPESNVLRTKHVLGNIYAECEVPDTFPVEFAIYDLSEMLSSYSLMKDPELTFTDTHVLMESDKNKIKYYYSNKSVIVHPVPGKNINFPGADVSFDLTAQDFSNLMKASSILKVNSVEFNVNGITLSDSKAVGNQFTIEKDMTSNASSFSHSILVENMMLISDLDYKVEVSEKGIAKFECADFGISYYIALNTK
jgi:hypothetical protein